MTAEVGAGRQFRHGGRGRCGRDIGGRTAHGTSFLLLFILRTGDWLSFDVRLTWPVCSFKDLYAAVQCERSAI